MRLDNDVEIVLERVFMSYGVPWVSLKVVLPDSSSRGPQPPARLKAGDSHEFPFANHRFFIDVLSVNPDRHQVTLAVRSFDRPRVGPVVQQVADKGNWERRQLDIPGIYYAVNNMALVKLSPVQGAVSGSDRDRHRSQAFDEAHPELRRRSVVRFWQIEVQSDGT